jgi:hypothetical protein
VSWIKICRYVNYERKSPGLHGGSRSNYGCHCMAVTLHENTEVYFSYETPVAFVSDLCHDGKLILCQNTWGPTTGKHLSAIWAIHSHGEKLYLPKSDFEAALEAVLHELMTVRMSRKVRIVERIMEVERVRKIVVPRVYKTVCESCRVREAKMTKAEKEQRNIVL